MLRAPRQLERQVGCFKPIIFKSLKSCSMSALPFEACFVLEAPGPSELCKVWTQHARRAAEEVANQSLSRVECKLLAVGLLKLLNLNSLKAVMEGTSVGQLRSLDPSSRMYDPLLLSGWPLLLVSSTGRLFAAAHRVMTDDVRPKERCSDFACRSACCSTVGEHHRTIHLLLPEASEASVDLCKRLTFGVATLLLHCNLLSSRLPLQLLVSFSLCPYSATKPPWPCLKYSSADHVRKVFAC